MAAFRSGSRRERRILVVLGALAVFVGGCGSRVSVQSYAEALAAGHERATELEATLPALGGPADLPRLTKVFGGDHGFRAEPVDQASAASVAVLLRREHRADWLEESTSWFEVVRSGQGPGSEALRLAVVDGALRFAEAGKGQGQDETRLRSLLREAARVLPGGCAGYAALGDGVAPSTLAPERHPHTSACMRRDLQRREHDDYAGEGLLRAAYAARAGVAAMLHASRQGAAGTSTEAALQPRITLALQSLEAVQLPLPVDPRGDAATKLQRAHAGAGVPLPPPPRTGSAPASATPPR